MSLASIVGRAASIAPEQASTRVIELFTSQGCPKCPAADRLITDLAAEPHTIALSYAVNYWDYAGWHDTLASPASTRRQHAYAAARGDRLIFTPQAIVDGIAVEPGADEAAIQRDMATLSAGGTAIRVPLDLSEHGGMLHIELGAALPDAKPDSVSGNVYVLRVARATTVDIDRGANSGTSVTYTNIVRAMSQVGAWIGQPVSFDMLELKGDGEGYVVLLQAGARDKPGRILAAAKTAGL